ncbi:MYXO-CTERM sorting domain-containing protein [Paraliomyxa miuraensis]|uniref:MYXO-CTERM sorting domain-containing protein n=1 Tax=Paraliomyxa miuraensis TaxID=376150 RepID=UPI00225B3A5E|nr:MYXO-CTERM sorting domain-containing protein [Paraliomyxa miuraensis]MCX4247863.1 MYXO-CTERM sorting domain-containing protein [Paraliomyxa miuraensis]
MGTTLFELQSASSSDEVLAGLEAWISGHEGDLGLPDGLSPELLSIEVLEESRARHGKLELFRFYQYYQANGGRALVVGDGSTITVEVGPLGAVSVKGTILDPRQPFEHEHDPAGEEVARQAIAHHVADRTGAPASTVKVEDLGLVAVPGPNAIGWQGVAYLGGQVPVATVIVAAAPRTPAAELPLLAFERNSANGVSNTVGVQVVTEDLGSDITTAPISEAVVSSLLDSSSLLGSIEDLSGWPQLASETVVALDLQGNSLEEVQDEIDFSRYIDASGDFDVSQPGAAFDAQRHYHISQEAYALVDHLAAGSWDSAISLFDDFVPDPADPSNEIGVPKTSDYGPGQFRPRIIDANGHAPLGGPTGQAGFGLVESMTPVLEAYQSPGPGLQSEVVSFIRLPPGPMGTHVLMHELGHAFDVFLGPGFPRTHAPKCQAGLCDSTCDEDTPDEALPLTETIAQMFTLWQFQRIGGIPFEDCGIIDLVMTGAGQGSTLVQHEACMGDADQISLFLRDDDPACLDPFYCDKPSNNETDPSQGGTHLCDATAGYNVTSLLQAWWSLLHWQYCEPTFPFSCETLPAIAWPLGCDAPGSSSTCATDDELAVLPFLYALRTDPLTYEQLIDEMVTFVACNYGTEAYTWFNQVLCDHHLRSCGEPPPMICQSCGNGIREGVEQCDGLDMGGVSLGEIPTCEGEGFEGGVLMCDPMTCTYDFGQCIAAASSSSSSSDGGLDPESSGGTSTSWNETETSVGGVGDPGGCDCRTSGGDGGWSAWLLGMMLLMSRRRRMQQSLGTDHGSVPTEVPTTCEDPARGDWRS